MTYRFDGFSLDSDTRQLLGAEGEVHVSPKALALLLVLVEQRARALSKAELQDRLWPSTFVGETNLATLVAELRRALGDSTRAPRYVRTVHRYGYRFVASVAEERTAAALSARGSRMYVTTPDRHFPLTEGVTVIGRGTDAAIRIDAGGVSRHHARLIVSDGAVRVEDLGSKNGTFVQGERITGACVLHDGDRLQLGPVSVTFRVAVPTGATETMK